MNRLPELPADFQLYFDSSTECHHCSKTIGEDCAVICVSCGVESEIIRLKMNNLTPYVWNYAKVRTLISCDNCVVRNCPTDHQSTTSLLRCVLESHFDGQLATMLGQINAAKLPLKDRDVINTILRLKEKCLLSKSTEEGRIFVETALVLIQAVHQHQRSPNHEM